VFPRKALELYNNIAYRGVYARGKAMFLQAGISQRALLTNISGAKGITHDGTGSLRTATAGTVTACGMLSGAVVVCARVCHAGTGAITGWQVSVPHDGLSSG
jgi:hypothetical protein